VKLTLPDGTTTDVVANTLPSFGIEAVDESFFELARASRPGPAQLWRLPRYLVRHPRQVRTLARNLEGLRPPISYAAPAYYAIHAYRWVDANGRARWVRYEFVPEVRERRLSWLAARRRGPDYLREELQGRLARGPVRFTWRVRIAGPGDDVDDPTAVWPRNRPVVDVGRLEITGLDRVPESADRILVFDPTRVVDGIELSDDPILHFRAAIYRASVASRVTPNAR
jgi:catalase